MKYLVFKKTKDVFTGAEIHFISGIFENLEDAEDSRYGRHGGFIQEVPDTIADLYKVELTHE